MSVLLMLASPRAPLASYAINDMWVQKVSRIRWVAYSPPTANPNRGIEAKPEAIEKDLAVLRKAGFTGLITYGSLGVLGRELPALARSHGFEGLIVGLWDPANQEEITNAETAAKEPIVLGFCVGNEGLEQRYGIELLTRVIRDLRKTTGKPVTTTEIIEKYSNEKLLNLGDWVFPNAHPFFHNELVPDAAVRWTKAAYDDLRRRSSTFVMFKEVGLPTAGDVQGRMSEAAQARYYQELAKTDVRFVYFEAFDQPWKTHLPIEPHWGIFRSDRTPKSLGSQLTGMRSRAKQTKEPFYIYEDVTSAKNHYRPTGYMGDIGDIRINEAFEGQPHSGKSSIQIVYAAKGVGPSKCDYTPPCRWAGVYWQEPPNNWGTGKFWKERGFDLRGFDRLMFWARADRECTIEFKVGGIVAPYGDSLVYPRSTVARLNKNWQQFQIDLKGADLKHTIGAFCWVTRRDINREGATFYLDDIRFEE